MTNIPYSNSTHYRVYYRDSDAAGVMYYGRYADVFEIGRTELFRSVGTNARELQFTNNIVFPVTSYSVKYKKPAMLDDALMLKTTLNRLGRCSINCSYHLFHEKTNALIAEAQTVNVSVNISNMRLVKIPPVLKNAFN